MVMKVEIEQCYTELQSLGWSQAALDTVFLAEMASLPYESERQSLFEEAFLFGSPLLNADPPSPSKLKSC